ncbi:hypothetical protein [Litoribacter populi]|uniref:hypothetical protein n=1 Tax=Litoribacter populi TaxID=2598460 RepID=UPI00117FCA21|nr:hypothetical protein [Litoribacter populi]
MKNNLEEQVKLDFSEFNFCPPLLSIFFSAIVNNSQSLKVELAPSSSYPRTIRFLEGFNPIFTENWQNYLEAFSGKSYLPIIKFNNGKTEVDTTVRNNILTGIFKNTGFELQ